MNKRMNEYSQQEKIQQNIHRSRNLNFVELIDKVKGIMPSAGDIEVSAFDYTVEDIREAILNSNLKAMREISNYFFRSSILYRRLIYLFCNMHLFYWCIIPVKTSFKETKNNKANKDQKDYIESLNYLNKFRFPDTTPDIIEAILREGVYYGYLIEGEASNAWQQLPAGYCRSNFKQDLTSIVEFDIKYFDDKYRNEEDRIEALKKYPAEFKKYYNAFKSGSIKASGGGTSVWCPLNLQLCTKFSFSDDDMPLFFPLIREIIRLEKNKQLDDKQSEQLLFKLLVNKMPLDKNGDLLFDIEETKTIHKNASAMLGNAPGVDLFTTWSDVNLLNVDTGGLRQAKKASDAASDFYIESATSKELFSTEGNLALEFSVTKDFYMIVRLMEKYSTFINKRLSVLFNPKNSRFNFKFLDVSILNQENKIKSYKELATLGYPKFLPAIASGTSQSELSGLLELENSLQLGSMMIPLQSSHTGVQPTGGRPAKDDTEKADTTIENIVAKG